MLPEDFRQLCNLSCVHNKERCTPGAPVVSSTAPPPGNPCSGFCHYGQFMVCFVVLTFARMLTGRGPSLPTVLILAPCGVADRMCSPGLFICSSWALALCAALLLEHSSACLWGHTHLLSWVYIEE